MTINNSGIRFDQNLFSTKRREELRNTEATVGDSRHTREMLQSDLTNLSATMHLSVSGLSIYFGQKLGSFTNDGIQQTLSNFEGLHANIMENFQGIERDQRIAALELAFESQAIVFAFTISSSIIQESGIELNVDENATQEEITQSGIAWNRMSEIKEDVLSMLRESLNFFRANGTFAGFETTAAANRPGMMSFQDLDLLSNLPRNENGGFASDVSALPLSNSGRELLSGVAQRNFI